MSPDAMPVSLAMTDRARERQTPDRVPSVTGRNSSSVGVAGTAHLESHPGSIRG